MSECLDADVLVAVGDALERRADAAKHLQTCAVCRSQLEALQVTRTALCAGVAVPPVSLSAALSVVREARRQEQVIERRTSRWRQFAEAVAAGFVALLATVSSRVPLDSPAAAVTAFAVGALLMATGSALAQKVSVDSSI